MYHGGRSLKLLLPNPSEQVKAKRYCPGLLPRFRNSKNGLYMCERRNLHPRGRCFSLYQDGADCGLLPSRVKRVVTLLVPCGTSILKKRNNLSEVYVGFCMFYAVWSPHSGCEITGFPLELVKVAPRCATNEIWVCLGPVELQISRKRFKLHDCEINFHNTNQKPSPDLSFEVIPVQDALHFDPCVQRRDKRVEDWHHAEEDKWKTYVGIDISG